MATIESFNEACDPGEYDPDVLDGNATDGVRPEKSNWAVPIDEPPFYGYPVTVGMTFAFGGVAITPEAGVLDMTDSVIPGLFAAGNATGGLFYENFPGSTGLTNAAVFGKVAAESAVESLRRRLRKKSGRRRSAPAGPSGVRVQSSSAVASSVSVANRSSRASNSGLPMRSV